MTLLEEIDRKLHEVMKGPRSTRRRLPADAPIGTLNALGHVERPVG